MTCFHDYRGLSWEWWNFPMQLYIFQEKSCLPHMHCQEIPRKFLTKEKIWNWNWCISSNDYKFSSSIVSQIRRIESSTTERWDLSKAYWLCTKRMTVKERSWYTMCTILAKPLWDISSRWAADERMQNYHTKVTSSSGAESNSWRSSRHYQM